MATIAYPTGLPYPQVSAITPAERRALSQADRPREARNIQRDRLEYERITWPAMPAAKTDQLLTWWRDTLVFGGAWFPAAWPGPRGAVTAVRKFIDQPKWGFVAGGRWRLSALCEVRGRGAEPRDRDLNTILLMHMDAPLGSTELVDECGHDGILNIEQFGLPAPSATAKISSFSPLVGAGSLVLPGPGSEGTSYRYWGNIPSFSALAIAGPFTIELSHLPGLYPTAGSGGQLILSQLDDFTIPNNLPGLWSIEKTIGALMQFSLNDDLGTVQVVSAPGEVTFDASTRLDIAVCRDGAGLVSLYVGGVKKADNSAGVYPSITVLNTRTIGIGSSIRGGLVTNNFADGRYDEIRISNICRYTANYTPAFPFRNP